ncbi:hypothetical protein [Nocardia carnea]|uniref:Conjugal transfer protein TrbC n=1 Tax=Nocardia carnea TaxID=37328 RepID=A0ABW7TG40_9NOCA|nr:hypothetical protein [Nocardia carnea]
MATITRSSDWINLIQDVPSDSSPASTCQHLTCAHIEAVDTLAKLTDNTTAFALSFCLAVAIAVIAWLVMAIGHSMNGATKIQAALRGAAAFGATFAGGLSVITVLSLLP